MIEAASYNLVGSFDDDSYPLNYDYFQKVVQVADGLTDASIIANGWIGPNIAQYSPRGSPLVPVVATNKTKES